MKQTAVEWLEEELNQLLVLFSTKEVEQVNTAIEQAKKIEKQQIIDACYFGSQNLPYDIKDYSEQYYKETFNK